jgi:hypothetical protein
MTKDKPAGRQADDDDPSDAEIIGMTIRHGTEHTRRMLDALGRVSERRPISGNLSVPDSRAIAVFVDAPGGVSMHLPLHGPCV